MTCISGALRINLCFHYFSKYYLQIFISMIRTVKKYKNCLKWPICVLVSPSCIRWATIYWILEKRLRKSTTMRSTTWCCVVVARASVMPIDVYRKVVKVQYPVWFMASVIVIIIRKTITVMLVRTCTMILNGNQQSADRWMPVKDVSLRISGYNCGTLSHRIFFLFKFYFLII